jgi:hypothetical protein
VLKPKTRGKTNQCWLIETQGADAHFYICYVKDLHCVAPSNRGDDNIPQCDLDSHAATCLAPSNMLEIAYNDGQTLLGVIVRNTVLVPNCTASDSIFNRADFAVLFV